MARAAILREMGGVFGAYNIQVDRRHLELIADYMVRHYIGNFFRLGPTRDRHLKGGINHSIGRVSQITHRHCSRLLMRRRQHFSRTRRFYGDFDDLTTPSGNIVLGRPNATGTGVFDIVMPV